MTRRILLSSLIGTSVEFYDFYIYATAASLIFGPIFFPSGVSSAELLGAYASFGIAFIARPLGGTLFGHFGDRVGRKTTLVISLLLMGICSAAIGFLPTYAVAGWLAPLLLCLLRFGQGLALGGEWTGAALIAFENAPPGWKTRYAMFAPLGAPVGFVLANGLFLILTLCLTPEDFADWGWRIPFIASAPLVWLGLWVRFNLVETREYSEAMADESPASVPLLEVFKNQWREVIIGALGVIACFSLYYTVTAFMLGYGTGVLGYERSTFLMIELAAIGFMAVAIILASWWSDRQDAERVLMFGCYGTIVTGIVLAPMLGSGSLVTIFMLLAFSLTVMGVVNGPLGAWLPGLFPARVRYTGTSVAFNIGGILGGAFSPIISQTLANMSGLVAVGFYVTLMGGISLVAFDASARRRALSDLSKSEARYRSIFEQNHIALCEIDLSQLADLVINEAKEPSQHRGATSPKCGPQNPESFGDLILLADANRATLQLLGCERASEVLGPISVFLPPESELPVKMLAALSAGASQLETETALIDRNGGERLVHIVLALPSNALERVACAIVDITEREHAREAMLLAQGELARAGRIATVGAISASIAHEVNQPIGAAVMSAQACMRWLAASPPDIQSATKAAERAVQHSLRASKIIQKTRELLRGEKRSVGALEVKTLISEVLDLMERELLTARVRVAFRLAEPSIFIQADRLEMQQLLTNLITNAIQAMRERPATERQMEIAVRAHETSDRLAIITISDNGPGISDDNLAKLFNPFFTTKKDGMGVGLAICKTIAEAHGGSLSARNSDTGGAIFDIAIPLAGKVQATSAA
ncbi:histidine kinase [Martelella endophytica]|uniref:histidine kinase n=2 Tax=Martelella endophytica TaxID=1486262 RepID=A0A0D5LVN6_MAREN|nr:histidine kinase [Martelella endophytica]